MGKTLPSVAEYFHVSVPGSFDFMRVVAKSTWSTNARLGEKARPAYFFVSPRHFDFLAFEAQFATPFFVYSNKKKLIFCSKSRHRELPALCGV